MEYKEKISKSLAHFSFYIRVSTSMKFWEKGGGWMWCPIGNKWLNESLISLHYVIQWHWVLANE